MDNYLTIRNWEKWQTYRKDRGQPPWIKIHRQIRLNPKWVQLSDSERGQLIALWLLAADKEGKIPQDPKLIQKLCFMTTEPKLNKFIELGFINSNGCRDDARATPSGCRDDRPKAETEAETEAKAETEEKNTCALTCAGVSEKFERFWSAYPKKKSKDAALKAFKKRKPDEQLFAAIMDGLERAKTSEQWTRENGKYIPYPATWLNAGAWMDEETEIESAPYSETTAQNLRVLKDWRPT